jgi:hypothetical protein
LLFLRRPLSFAFNRERALGAVDINTG